MRHDPDTLWGSSACWILTSSQLWSYNPNLEPWAFFQGKGKYSRAFLKDIEGITLAPLIASQVIGLSLQSVHKFKSPEGTFHILLCYAFLRITKIAISLSLFGFQNIICIWSMVQIRATKWCAISSLKEQTIIMKQCAASCGKPLFVFLGKNYLYILHTASVLSLMLTFDSWQNIIIHTSISPSLFKHTVWFTNYRSRH